MLTGRDFIVFSDDWGRHPFSCQHIMQHFLATNRILWVNTIGMRNPRFTAYDIKRSVEKIKGWLRPHKTNHKQLPDNLTILSPFMLPYSNYAVVRERNKRSVLRSVKRVTDHFQFRHPIVLTTLPNAVDYVGELCERLSVYYCVDDFTHWPGVDSCLVTEMEEALLRKVDYVCASSEELCRKKARFGTTPKLLAHGVDNEHFHMPAGGELQTVPRGTRRVIGFFGALSAWVDYGLLLKLARMRPDWLFLLVGPVDTDVSILTNIENIHLAGKIPYEDLPKVAESFDVALIPFVINDMTLSVNPLKLMEYLACGLPVVSTPLPEVLKFSDLVYIADSVETFAQSVERALLEDSPDLKQKRRELASHYSWKSVAETFSAAVEQAARTKECSSHEPHPHGKHRNSSNYSDRVPGEF